jgi:glycosyltransferase involved in cell wall biosynthesis
MGHSVLIPPHQEGYPVDKIFNSLQDRPDLVIFTDHLGVHVFPEGLTNVYGIPKIYYAVDTPINYWWQIHYAHLFDYTFTDQKPLAQTLTSMGLKSSWLPVGVDTKSYLPSSNENPGQVYDFGFVGSLDPARRLKRTRLVETLSNRFTIKTAGSHQEGWVNPQESSQIYRQSRLALNESLFSGVTTRMLEAMASGSVLFTEKAGGDLGELFKAGEDFAWFEPAEVIDVANSWLGDDKRRRRAAKRSLEKVTAAHDISHRAETLINTIRRVHYGHAQVDCEGWDREGRAMFLTSLRWPQEGGKNRMIRAEVLLEKAYNSDRISPNGLFMLGHIKRMRHNLSKGAEYLSAAFELGEPRGALGMAILKLGEGDLVESRRWFNLFTQSQDCPELSKDTLPFELVKMLAKRLVEIGEEVTPGFSRMKHDPTVWNAFEFYQSAFSGKPDDLEVGIALSELLMKHGAAAEAMEIAQKALEYHPENERLGEVFTLAGRASYLTVN